jgi:hypothetical protein
MNGFMNGNEVLLINLTKGETKLVLDQRLNTKVGFVSGIKMVPALNQVPNNVFRFKSMIKIMSVEINKLHEIPGKCGKTRLKETANSYGIKFFWKARSL